MKRAALLFIALILGIAVAAAPAAQGAGEVVSAPPLIISEVKIKTGGTFDEFVELTNISPDAIELGSYALQYFNSAAPADTAKPTKGPVTLPNAQLPGGGSVVFAKTPAPIPGAQPLGIDPLSDTGGLVQLVEATAPPTGQPRKVYDQVAWSSALTPLVNVWPIGASTNTESKSQSLRRQQDDADQPVLTNAVWVMGDPNPVSVALVLPPDPEPLPVASDPVLDAPNPDVGVAADDPAAPFPAPLDEEVADAPDAATVDPGPEASTDQPQATQTYLPIHITELLPNPAAPATDADDEYVELHNPNSQAVNLDGYKLQTGSNYTYSHTFGSVTLPAGGYQVFYSRDTSLTLSNTAGRARLLDPAGTVVNETAAYGAAAEGSTWAFVNNSWQWTTSATPGLANVFSQTVKFPTTTTKAAAAKKTTAAKTSTATTKKAAATKAATAAKPKAAAAAKTTAAAAGGESGAKNTLLHTGVLAGVGALTVGYGAYEYRHDLANRLEQFRRNRAARRAAGGKA
jgi:hypothetical protein